MKPESWQPVADTLGYKDEPEMLKDLYCSQGFSLMQMAKMLGFSMCAVRNRLIMHGIPRKKKGGAVNRLGRGKLRQISDEELVKTSARELSVKYNVHISTVFSEVRRRAKEKRNEILSDYTSERLRGIQAGE